MQTDITASNLKLKIERHGQGPLLVLLHGWGMNSAVWQPIKARLGNQFTLLLVDLPGFGDSPALESNTSLEQWVEMVITSVGEPAHYLGWSLGGLIAQQLSLQAPQQVLSLVTLASSPCFMSRLDWPGIAPAVLHQFSNQLQRNLPKTLDRFFALQALGSPAAKEDAKRVKSAVAQRPVAQKVALMQGLDFLREVDLRSQVGQIQAPWLRLYGQADSLIPVSSINQLNQLAPKSQVQILLKAAHAPFISHPEETMAALGDFYRNLNGSIPPIELG